MGKSLYTLGLSKTVLIVGLGNIGEMYATTRHNAGFMVLEAFATAHSFDAWIMKKDLKSMISTGDIGGVRVVLCKPLTMMNLSGEAAQACARFFKIAAADMVAVHDELEIDFGLVRCRVGGSAAGHNGVKSLLQHSGEEFGRVRVGIGPKVPEQIDSADFVLQNFSKEEKAQLPQMTKETTAILTEYIAGGTLPHDTRRFL